MKTILLIVLAVVVGVVGFAYIRSGDYDVERSVVIQADADEVFPYLNNLRKWEEWTVWTEEKYPKMKRTYSGPEAGVGAKSVWTDEENGNGQMEIVRSDPSTGVEYSLDFEGFPSSVGIVGIEETDGGVKVTMRNRGSVGNNPMFRVVGLFLSMDKMMGSEFEESLANLKSVVESDDAS